MIALKKKKFNQPTSGAIAVIAAQYLLANTFTMLY